MAARKTTSTRKPATKRSYNRRPKPVPVAEDFQTTEESVETQQEIKSQEQLLAEAKALVHKLDPAAEVAFQLTKATLYDMRDLGVVERVSFLAMLTDLGYVDHGFRKLTDNMHNFSQVNAGVELNHNNKLARFVDERTVQTQPSAKIGASVKAEFGFTEEIAPIPDRIDLGGETYVRVIKEALTDEEGPWAKEQLTKKVACGHTPPQAPNAGRPRDF